MDGEEFLRRMRRQDPQVWDDLMPMLYRIAAGACRDLRVFDAQREDIIQDVALKVFTQWASYDARSRLATWIYAIARNRCLDEWRRQQVRHPVSSDATPEEDAGLALHDQLPDPGQSDMEQRLCVQQVLAALDEQGAARNGSMRMIDVLRWWVEQSPTTEELAAFLRTTAAGAKERKRYILQHLRTLCRKYCGHDECALVQPA